MTESRFKAVSSNDLKLILDAKDSTSTKSTISRAVKLFRVFLKESGESEDFESLTKEQLDGLLQTFYASLRRNDRQNYKTTTLVSIKYGLAKYVKSCGNVDINDQIEFSMSNEVFKAVCKQLKREGNASVTHYPPITTEDVKVLYSGNHNTFNIDTPVGLQQKVWFEMMFYLCRRGRENQRGMTKQTFKISTDGQGKNYVYQAIDELDKNHSYSDKPDDTVGEARMYEQPGNEACPVASFSKYLAKLSSKQENLWQRPRDFFEGDDDWYHVNMPLGKNALGNMMKRISVSAQLSKMYTNHSIRATHVTILDEAGFEARHIMRTTGHKSESSIRSYSSRLSDGKKRDISSTLARAAGIETDENRGEEEGNSRNIPVIVRSEVQASHERMSLPVPATATHSTPDDWNMDVPDDVLASIPEHVLQPNNTVFNFCPHMSNCTVTFNVYQGKP
jgi:hypothetical protein